MLSSSITHGFHIRPIATKVIRMTFVGRSLRVNKQRKLSIDLSETARRDEKT